MSLILPSMTQGRKRCRAPRPPPAPCRRWRGRNARAAGGGPVGADFGLTLMPPPPCAALGVGQEPSRASAPPASASSRSRSFPFSRCRPLRAARAPGPSRPCRRWRRPRLPLPPPRPAAGVPAHPRLHGGERVLRRLRSGRSSCSSGRGRSRCAGSRPPPFAPSAPRAKTSGRRPGQAPGPLHIKRMARNIAACTHQACSGVGGTDRGRQLQRSQTIFRLEGG